MTHLHTARLELRSFCEADVGELYAFMSDRDAMQHTYVARSRDHCAARLARYEAMRARLGFAPWVIRLQGDAPIIGWGGLSLDPDEPEWGLEVSYAFAPWSWGKGYASELVAFCARHALNELEAPELHAFAKPENGASLRVLQKCGFAKLRFEAALSRDHYLLRAQGFHENVTQAG